MNKTKKIFAFFNFLFALALAVLCVIYYKKGGIMLKSVCSCTFTVAGIINAVFCFVSHSKKPFPVIMCLGFALCTLGDIVIFYNFILGALLFALGHVTYVAAYCVLRKPRAADLAFIIPLSVVSVCTVTLAPAFEYGSVVMAAVAAVYAAIISVMLGKSVSNAVKKRSALNITVCLGSIMFFVSDVALAFNVFGGAPSWADPLCLVTYFPGQFVIAFSLYLYGAFSAEKE